MSKKNKKFNTAKLDVMDMKFTNAEGLAFEHLFICRHKKRLNLLRSCYQDGLLTTLEYCTEVVRLANKMANDAVDKNGGLV